MSVAVHPAPLTTKPRRVPLEVRLPARVLEDAHAAAARCGTTVPALIGELLETWLATRRCTHGTARPPDPPEAA